ncbi:choline/ethanolamine kinase-like [Oppia nitens]|uniref:choline/ethanolamine kinase-like n=1 Tax=Oppia nitens TaxID=1686743 RepID=UPI0023DBC866|nr:choline/ethanolamine kinase-like [Oppia nitens]
MSSNVIDLNSNIIKTDSTQPPLKLERGQTIDNFKQKCYELCQQYLGGIWLNTTIDEVEVRRLSGGLTNQLYYCAINKTTGNTSGDDIPHEVVVRFYQEKHFSENERMSDTVIAVLISGNNLGPKLYGIFPGGQIQKYYQHKCFRLEQQKDPKLVDEVAKRLARIHTMDVPNNRSKNWLFDYFDSYYEKANQLYNIPALIDEYQCETLKQYDIKQELDWLKDMIIKSKSPIVFNHVDFRGSNIMITENDGLVLCDFEYSAYGYRGFDFGTIYLEWGTDPLLVYSNGITELAADTEFEPFIKSYFQEMVGIYGDKFATDPRNTVDAMLKEIKLFSLVAYMFIVIFTLQQTESVVNGNPYDKKYEMKEVTEKIYTTYHTLKRKYIQQNLLKF